MSIQGNNIFRFVDDKFSGILFLSNDVKQRIPPRIRNWTRMEVSRDRSAHNKGCHHVLSLANQSCLAPLQWGWGGGGAPAGHMTCSCPPDSGETAGVSMAAGSREWIDSCCCLLIVTYVADIYNVLHGSVPGNQGWLGGWDLSCIASGQLYSCIVLLWTDWTAGIGADLAIHVCDHIWMFGAT